MSVQKRGKHITRMLVLKRTTPDLRLPRALPQASLFVEKYRCGDSLIYIIFKKPEPTQIIVLDLRNSSGFHLAETLLSQPLQHLFGSLSGIVFLMLHFVFAGYNPADYCNCNKHSIEDKLP